MVFAPVRFLRRETHIPYLRRRGFGMSGTRDACDELFREPKLARLWRDGVLIRDLT